MPFFLVDLYWGVKLCFSSIGCCYYNVLPAYYSSDISSWIIWANSWLCTPSILGVPCEPTPQKGCFMISQLCLLILKLTQYPNALDYGDISLYFILKDLKVHLSHICTFPSGLDFCVCCEVQFQFKIFYMAKLIQLLQPCFLNRQTNNLSPLICHARSVMYYKCDLSIYLSSICHLFPFIY